MLWFFDSEGRQDGCHGDFEGDGAFGAYSLRDRISCFEGAEERVGLFREFTAARRSFEGHRGVHEGNGKGGKDAVYRDVAFCSLRKQEGRRVLWAYASARRV